MNRTVNAPADKRFHRARAAPGASRGPWRRVARRVVRLTVIVGALAASVGLLDRWVRTSHVFAVDTIVVRGVDRLSTGEVSALVDDVRGRNILGVDLESVRRRVLESRWVGDAALRRLLPSSIEITVIERQPMGVARIGVDLFLVDGRGEIIEPYGPDHTDIDLPIIDGLAVHGAERSRTDEERARLAAQILAALRTRSDLARRVSQIDVRDPRDAVVVLEGETALVHLGDRAFVERLLLYTDVAPALHERTPDIDQVDVRYGDRVFVRPVAKGAGGRAR